MAQKVGSVYAEIRAKLDKLQKDLQRAQGLTVQSTKQIQNSINKLNFDRVGQSALSMAKQVAAAYASVRVAQAAISSAEAGSVLIRQEQAFGNLAVAANTSSREIVDALKTASQGMVSEGDLMTAAGKAMLMSLPANDIIKLMEIAAATSRMTGQTITEAFNDITLGVARQSRMILDNLGIIVDVDKANKEYARGLKKTVEELTDAEKRQSFMNEVMRSGADMIARLGDKTGTLEGVNKLVAAHSDLWNEVNKTVAKFLDSELSNYAKALQGISSLLKGMAQTSDAAARKSAESEINMLRSLEAKGLAQPGTTAAKLLEFNRRYAPGRSEAELAGEQAFKTWQKPDWMASWKEREGQWVDFTAKELEEMVKARDAAMKKHQDEIKKAADETQRFRDEIKKLEDEFEQAKIFSGEDSNYERLQAMLRSGSQIGQMEAQRAEVQTEAWAKAAARENEILMDKVKDYKKSFDSLTVLSERTAEAMQDNFSDLFFDMMTGELKSLEDYANAVFRSIAKMASDLMSQQLTQALFGKDFKGGGLFSTIGGMFGGGAANLPINQPVYSASGQVVTMPFHSGGVVGASGGAARSIPASAFRFAPRYHSGLMADEKPAILQQGETVIPKGGASGGGSVTNYYIQAMDVRSFTDYLRKSGAVQAIASENIRSNGILRKTLRSKL